MSPYLSKAIAVTRFPIIIGPVMIHCQTMFEATPYRLFWGEMVGRITVPLFFIISGYLFFQKFDGSFEAYKYKIKKRVSSLLIPYLLWNLLAFLYYWLIGIAEGKDFLSSFWVVDYHTGHSPADGPLWFLRTLILLLPFTPIMYFLNTQKYLRWISILIYLSLFFNTGIFKQGIYIGFATFNLGAFFSLNSLEERLGRKTTPPNQPKCRQSLMIVMAFIIVCYLDYNLSKNSMCWGIAHWTVLTIGSAITMLAPKYLEEKTEIVLMILGRTSFFLFCLHEPIIPYIRSGAIHLVGNGNLGYTLTIILTVIVCLVVYKLLERIWPSALALLSGGR